jgi:transposase-like protein
MAKITKTLLVKLQKSLKTDVRIGEELGISRQAVHQWRKKLGVESLVSDKIDRNAAIVAAYEGGATGTEVAAKFGLSVSQTYRIIDIVRGKAKRAGRKAAEKLAKKPAGRKPAKKAPAAKKKKKKKR